MEGSVGLLSEYSEVTISALSSDDLGSSLRLVGSDSEGSLSWGAASGSGGELGSASSITFSGGGSGFGHCDPMHCPSRHVCLGKHWMLAQGSSTHLPWRQTRSGPHVTC